MKALSESFSSEMVFPCGEENLLSGCCEMTFLEWGSTGKEIYFQVLWNDFPLGAWFPPARGQGILTSPMPPGPYTPFKRPRDTPTPFCGVRVLPLFLDRQGPYRARPLFCLGPATNRVPQRPRTLPGTLAAVRTATRYSCRGGSFCHHPGINGAQEPGRDHALKATVALPGTDVKLAGRPARLAVHCCLVTGVRGGHDMHFDALAPLGTFQ